MPKIVKGSYLRKDFYHSLPHPFNLLSQIAEKKEREIKFLSVMVALSACMPNYHTRYRGSKIYPHSYLFISGGSGTGKGDMRIADDITSDIDASFRKERIEDRVRYKADVAASSSGAADVEPLYKRRLVIGSNITGAVLISNLDENPHGLLMISPEADILMSSMKSEHGKQIDALLRCAFHHENYRKQLKTDDYEAYINEPKIACLISGTPNQLKDYFKKASDPESGLASRFLIYNLPQMEYKFTSQGRDHCPFTDPCRQVANQVFGLLDSMHDLVFTMKSSHLDTLDAILNDFGGDLIKLDGGYASIINRLGVSLLRILMVFTALRSLDDLERKGYLQPLDSDFELIKTMCSFLGEHVLNAVEECEILASSRPKKVHHLVVLKGMPKIFSYKELVDSIVGLCKKTRRSAERNAEIFVNKGLITKNEDRMYTRNI